MTGERWPDKRARAVLFAGAKKQSDDTSVDPDAVADAGLRVRELLFTDDEVREDNANPKEHQIGFSGDCMQFATLQPGAEGLLLGLWLGPEAAKKAKQELGAADDPNPFRNHFGWVRLSVSPKKDVQELAPWIERARSYAREQKKGQEQTVL